MKKFKIILDLSALILISIMLFVFSFEEAEEIIPESSNVITIEKWDKSSHKTDVINTLKNEAELQDIQIVKVIKDVTKQKKEKEIYLFNSKQTSSLVKDNIASNNLDKLLEKEVKGKYYIVGNDFNHHKIIEALKGVGITSQIEELDRTILFLDLLLENNLFIPIISVFILYILYFLYDRSINLKLYAIQKLNGFSNSQIIYHGSKGRMLYWVTLIFVFFLTNWLLLYVNDWLENPYIFLFRLMMITTCFILLLVTAWLLSYLLLLTIDINLMIKGKRAYKSMIFMGMFTKYLMIIILSILIVQNIETYKKVSNIYNSQDIWDKLNDYYTIDFSPKMRNEDEQKELEYKVYNLVKSEEKKGGILLKNNNMNMPQKNNYIPENGNVFFANENFIKYYSSIDNNFKRIKDNKAKIDVYLPPRFKNRENEIKKNGGFYNQLSHL